MTTMIIRDMARAPTPARDPAQLHVQVRAQVHAQALLLDMPAAWVETFSSLLMRNRPAQHHPLLLRSRLLSA